MRMPDREIMLNTGFWEVRTEAEKLSTKDLSLFLILKFVTRGLLSFFLKQSEYASSSYART